MNRAETGHRGEAAAARWYQKQGCRLLAHNFHTRMGELDVVVQEPDGTIIICEVKTRSSDAVSRPAAAVNAAGRYRKEKKMKIDSLIFDLDGTLWDSSEGIVATWVLVLEHYPEIPKKVTAEELASNFGLPLDQIARNMFPEQTEALRMRLMDECCEQENIYLAEHGGILYPKLEETLQKLSEKYPLFIVSNCQDGYIQSFYSGNHTAKYFKDCECIGVTGKSKGANIRLVMERNGLKSPVYIGDTQGDADAAAQAGIPFIYAAYGFGQVKAFDAEIHTFEELLDIVE